MDDRFLPDRSALGVIHVVAFVQHDSLNIRERIIVFAGFRIEHVAEDLGGHHHDRGIAIHTQITRHQPDVLLAVGLTEITQLLVGQRLQRRCVEDLLVVRQGAVNRVFPHQGFAGARRRAHDNGMALIERVNRFQLEIIQRERKNGGWIEAGRRHHRP